MRPGVKKQTKDVPQENGGGKARPGKGSRPLPQRVRVSPPPEPPAQSRQSPGNGTK